jgi:hypothetical protein
LTSQKRYSCAEAKDRDEIIFDCGGEFISQVAFASFGTPTGRCDDAMQEANFKSSACHSMRSEAVLEERCLGQTTCMFVVSDELFGDPCKGRPKWLAARLACGDHTALDFAAREVCPSARRWGASHDSP